MAAAEQEKINAKKGLPKFQSHIKRLSDSRLELVLQKNAVSFDVTDLSLAYAAIIFKKYKGNRTLAENTAAKKLSALLKFNAPDEKLQFILKSWAVLLISAEQELKQDDGLRGSLRKLFLLKAGVVRKSIIMGCRGWVGVRGWV